MFVLTMILLVPFLMVMFLPLTLKFFSSDELDQMGVQLESAETTPGDLFPRSNSILPAIPIVCANS